MRISDFSDVKELRSLIVTHRDLFETRGTDTRWSEGPSRDDIPGTCSGYFIDNGLFCYSRVPFKHLAADKLTTALSQPQNWNEWYGGRDRSGRHVRVVHSLRIRDDGRREYWLWPTGSPLLRVKEILFNEFSTNVGATVIPIFLNGESDGRRLLRVMPVRAVHGWAAFFVIPDSGKDSGSVEGRFYGVQQRTPMWNSVFAVNHLKVELGISSWGGLVSRSGGGLPNLILSLGGIPGL